jgi:hypothetical protein
LVHCHAGCKPEAIVAAVGLALGDLFDDSRPSKWDPTADLRRRAVEGLEEWRQARLQLTAEELRARDTLRGAITRMVQAGEISEADAWNSLEGAYRGYSALEYKFEQLLRDQNTLQLWRESRKVEA